MASLFNNDFSPTAELPVGDERRFRLLETFHLGHLTDLYEELVNVAREDLNHSQNPIKSLRRPIGESSNALIADYNGAQHARYLLYSIPKPVIGAIIENTLGYRVKTDREFEKLLYKTTPTCGSYVNTFVRTADDEHLGKGLTRLEWKQVQKMVAW